MNDETREVLSALLAGRTYVFSLLHTLLGAQPTEALVAAATGEASVQALGLFAQDDAQGPKLLLAALDLLKDADMEALKAEYTRLFLGPDDMIAGPWESVYTSKERALFQESTLGVRAWFRRFGYVAGGYPNYPDDHISLMMDFLARTTQMAAEQLLGEDEKGCAAILEDQAAFEKEHMLNWLYKYARDIQMSETNVFYPQLAVAVAEFIACDQQVIAEMIEVCRA